MKQIIIATKNKGKAIEFKQFFSDYGIEAMSLLDMQGDIPDVEETGTTFEENAALKAEQMASLFDKPVLADDSGLMIDALDGRPGIYSARYAGEPKSDQANMNKVLEELTAFTALEERTARFVCVLAIAVPGEKTIFRKGYCEGTIAFSEAGENGFGYDPVFIPKGYQETMAQLSAGVKNSISHRKNAILHLDEWIQDIL
ncbi:XTP/dITP diphosphohydrolase [Virgibacillus halotolerans]|uniref:XTP/dITP diphosphatase n=1 Tax=Virgibacillus halotolerans TaxID=1071053 RepID=UPI001962028F|nr:XTP/dITP diphosphatase [Virgibacillus halotolerans]MBM7597782.1 XTP/dITP diphosphohydrolase [Virgibacillus halotolerans]